MTRHLIAIAAIAMIAVGCSSASDELSEQLVESVSGVEDLEIDEESGQVSFETEEGSFSIGGGEVPDGFPFPFPDGGQVMSSMTAGTASNVVVVYPKDRYEDLQGYIDDWTASEGGEWQTGSNQFTSAEGEELRSANWFSTDIQISLTDACPLDDGEDGACVTVATG
jgi:hypothetical protein